MSTEESPDQEDEYEIHGLAQNAARVGTRSLASIRGEDATKLTRRVVDGWVLNHEKQPEANVEITIRHQRRASAAAPWEVVDAYLLGSLPAGKEVRLALSSGETLKLYEELRRLYELAEKGVPAGSRRYRFVDADLADILDGREREALEAIIARSGDKFPELLGSIGGADLIALAAREREHGRRVEAVQEMEAHQRRLRLDRAPMEGVFRGEPVDLRSRPRLSLPHIGRGRGLLRRHGGVGQGRTTWRQPLPQRGRCPLHGPRGDQAARRGARNPAAVPERRLQPRPDLAGGVAQVQTNSRTWAVEGSTTKANQRRFDAEKTYTVEPKGILLVGHLGSLGEEPEWVEAFEQYRRNLHNPEILTYDELLARAKFIVETAAARAEEAAAAAETERLAEPEPEDVEASRPAYEVDFPF